MSNFKTFLINDKRNSNGWEMPRDVILQTAASWIGRPGILFRTCKKCVYEHNTGRTLQEALAVSERDAVTRIVNVEWDDAESTLIAEHEITDPSFTPVLCDGKVWATSPSIWNNIPKEDIVTDYVPLHLAFLSVDVDPAYSAGTELEKDCVCKINKSNECSKTDMDPEKKKEEENKEEPQKMSMEDEIHEMHAMLKQAMAPKKEEPKDAPEQKKASASKKSFDWVVNTPDTPKDDILENTPLF